jgi:hypothetical protein
VLILRQGKGKVKHAAFNKINFLRLQLFYGKQQNINTANALHCVFLYFERGATHHVFSRNV